MLNSNLEKVRFGRQAYFLTFIRYFLEGSLEKPQKTFGAKYYVAQERFRSPKGED